MVLFWLLRFRPLGLISEPLELGSLVGAGYVQDSLDLFNQL